MHGNRCDIIPSMKELPKKGLETHPLWPLYKFITAEQFENFGRLVASDFGDTREANFQAFLQEEVKNRLSKEFELDLAPPYTDTDMSREVIVDPKVKKEYELEWRSFFDNFKASKEPLNKTRVLKEIDSLFEIWNNAVKIPIVIFLN